MSERYNNPDDVIVEKLLLTSLDGSRQVNIKNLLASLEIVVGLGHTIYGTLLLADGTGLFSSRRNSAIGEEFIEIEFKTPGASEFRKYKFIVSRITEISRTTQNDGIIVSLSLVSVDYFINNGKFISKSYKGNIHEIIKTILTSELQTDINISAFEETEGSVQFAFTKTKPFEKIELLKKYAYKDNQTPMNFFTFYENFSGYNFKSLSSLFQEEKNTVAPTYKHSPLSYTNIQNRDSIIEFAVPSVTDLQKKLYYGYFKTNVYSYDVFTKQFETRTYDLTRARNNLQPLETNEIGTSTQLSQRLASLSGLDYFIPQDTSNPNSLIPSAISSSPYMLQLEENMLLIKVYGNSVLDVPTLVNIEFPEISPTPDPAQRELDKNLSGKYIIQKISHKIEVDGARLSYFNDIALVRNSSKIPQQNYDSRYNSDNIQIKALQDG